MAVEIINEKMAVTEEMVTPVQENEVEISMTKEPVSSKEELVENGVISSDGDGYAKDCPFKIVHPETVDGIISIGPEKPLFNHDKVGFMVIDNKISLGRLVFSMYSQKFLKGIDEKNCRFEIYYDTKTNLQINVTYIDGMMPKIDIIQLPIPEYRDQNLVSWLPMPKPKEILEEPEEVEEIPETPSEVNEEETEEVVSEEVEATEDNTVNFDDIIEYLNTSIRDNIIEDFAELVNPDIKDKVNPDMVLWSINVRVGSDPEDLNYTLTTVDNSPIFVAQSVKKRTSERLGEKVVGVRVYALDGVYFVYPDPETGEYWLEIIKEGENGALDVPENFNLHNSNMSSLINMINEAYSSEEA